jgi:hypothetical protein
MPFSRKAEETIKDFRGLPRDPLHDRSGAPKNMGSIIEACLERFAIGQQTAEDILLENWERIIGKDFAMRCRPRRIDGTTLIIEVPNPTVRREMLFIEDRILTAVASLPKCNSIRRVILTAGS